MSEVFVQPLSIEPADIDVLGHVNNIVYLRWAQDIAIAHWSARAEPDWLTRYVWVVTRHEVDYRAPLKLGEAAEARTRVDETGARGALWARFVDIGKPGEAPAVSIKSVWCMLDAASMRPRRVPKEVIAAFAG
jgi:acyl-CoA thioester hydrolase